MTTVPNRTVRILTDEELDRFGLSGANAVEDDLDRIRLARRCGTEFLQRRDAFRRAFDRQCMEPADAAQQDVAEINACGLELRKQYGFPDSACPVESPMAELDGAILMPREVEAPEAAPASEAGEASPDSASDEAAHDASDRESAHP